VRTFVRVLLAISAAYAVVLIACYFFGGYGIKRHQLESGLFVFAAVLLLTLFGVLRSTETSPAVVTPAPLVGLLAGITGVAVYSGALQVGLLSDDFVLQSWVMEGRLRWEGSQFERPVALAIWRVIFLAGGGAVVLHALNVALHLVNTLLAGRLAARLGLSRVGAAVAALTFLLWPTQVEPVVWAAGVFDVLASAWMLLALLICLRAVPLLPGQLDFVAVSALTALALFSKESAVALPVLGLVTLAPQLRPSKGSTRQIALLASLLPTVGYFYWRFFTGLPVAGTSSLSRYMAKEQLSRTFGTLAIPFSSETVHSLPILPFLIGAGVVLLVTALVAGSDRRSSSQVVAVQGALWGVLAAAPTIGFLFIGDYLEGSRYLYLAALGWGLTLGGITDAVWNRRYLRWPWLSLVSLLLLAAVVEQQRRLSDWRDAATRRDDILTEAGRFAVGRQCGSVSASNLPATFRGAQLFNNGFNEALQNAATNQAGSSHCEWTWTGRAFREK
jgi:hypothetical protein